MTTKATGVIRFGLAMDNKIVILALILVVSQVVCGNYVVRNGYPVQNAEPSNSNPDYTNFKGPKLWRQAINEVIFYINRITTDIAAFNNNIVKSFRISENSHIETMFDLFDFSHIPSIIKSGLRIVLDIKNLVFTIVKRLIMINIYYLMTGRIFGFVFKGFVECLKRLYSRITRDRKSVV